MTLIKRDTCQINSLNGKALGICNSDHTIELPYTIPGEIVEYEQHSYRNKNSYNLSKIIESSNHRVAAPCKYFGTCGGCSLQHLSPDYYHQYKLKNLQQTLNPLLSQGTPPISSMQSIGPATRRRAVFEAVKKQDQIFIGFKKFHSDKIVNIDSCLVLLPELSELINKLKLLLPSIIKDKEKCKILITKADNGIDLILETQHSVGTTHDIIIKNFVESNNIIRFVIINGGKWHLMHLTEQPYVLFEEIKIPIDNHSFLQVSSKTDHILSKLIKDILTLIASPSLQIVDLFCGRGTMTIPASKFGAVDGFESEKASVKTLKEAATTNNLPLNIYQRDLYNNPLQWDELNKYDVAIINPPRAGAKEQAIVLGTCSIKTIIYLSCNPETFLRDAQLIMLHNRYRLKEIVPIDQFYWSHHLEILGVFVETR
jgi:23S rRNA (uracil1939-C5)-methyltransferase